MISYNTGHFKEAVINQAKAKCRPDSWQCYQERLPSSHDPEILDPRFLSNAPSPPNWDSRYAIYLTEVTMGSNQKDHWGIEYRCTRVCNADAMRDNNSCEVFRFTKMENNPAYMVSWHHLFLVLILFQPSPWMARNTRNLKRGFRSSGQLTNLKLILYQQWLGTLLNHDKGACG